MGAIAADMALAALREAPVSDAVPLLPEAPSPRVGPERTAYLREKWCSFTAAELAQDPPRLEFIWEDFLPCGKVAVLAGAGGGGKTALLLGLAAARAMSEPYLGKHTRPGTTVVVSCEDSKDDYQRKLAAVRESRQDLDLDAIARHLKFVDLSGTPFQLVDSDFKQFAVSQSADDLVAVIREKAPDADFVILETVSRLVSEESNPALSVLVVAAEHIAKGLNASVLLVAHVSKDAARNGTKDGYAPRGGSAITDNARATLVLSPLNDDGAQDLLGFSLSAEELRDLMVLNLAKGNHSPRQSPIVVERVSSKFGITLRQYRALGKGSAEDAQRAARHEVGRRLWTIVRDQTERGEVVTENRLETSFRNRLGLAKHRVRPAVVDAIEDGFLVRAGTTVRGGGRPLVAAAFLPAGGAAAELPQRTLPANSPSFTGTGWAAGERVLNSPGLPVLGCGETSGGIKGVNSPNSPGGKTLPGELPGDFGGER